MLLTSIFMTINYDLLHTAFLTINSDLILHMIPRNSHSTSHLTAIKVRGEE